MRVVTLKAFLVPPVERKAIAYLVTAKCELRSAQAEMKSLVISRNLNYFRCLNRNIFSLYLLRYIEAVFIHKAMIEMRSDLFGCTNAKRF